MSSAFPSRVLDQLVSKTPFQFYLRCLAAASPRYNLETLSYLDERLDGMLSGILQLTPEELASQSRVLNSGTPGGLGVLTYAAAHRNDSKTINALAEEASCSEPKRTEFLLALQWLELQAAYPIAELLSHCSDPATCELGLAALVAHRLPVEAQLEQALGHTHTGLRTTAIRSVGELGAFALLDHANEHSADPDDFVRLATATTAARLSPTPDAIAILHKFVDDCGPAAEEAALWVGVAMPSEDWMYWMGKLTASTPHLPFALRSAIGQGDIRTVRWIIHAMNDASLSAASAEAFTALTGLDIAKAHLDQPKPGGGSPADPDDLPEPDVPKITAWWTENEHRFPSTYRWFFGEPLTLAGLRNALVKGNQRQRGWAVKVLGRLRPDKPEFPIAAPAPRQKKSLNLP